MTDYLTDSLAISALAGAGGAILLAVIEWFELNSARSQIEDERRKIEQLGKLVEALAAMVNTQQEQLSVLEKQAKIATDSLKIQEADLALRKEQAEWEQKGPFAKVGTWIDRWNEARRAKRGNRRGW
jgi:hypothetical protein